ncbi:hypothetical protein HID58_043801 [Brassica napus]|uniref:Uncharacterized protein n=1 Tax=Brassica napus TaxID=3708 RepID=A0ABQ8BJ16_BRANA|nr:hypothetical protein HID58_043801 [Brassica napus]
MDEYRLIGESSQTYVSRTGFWRRSGAICGGGTEIQASHLMELAPLKNRRTRSRRWRKKKRRREIVCTSATPRLVETEQHDGPSAPRDYPRHRFRFLMAAQETIQDIGLGYYFYFFVDCGLGYF